MYNFSSVNSTVFFEGHFQNENILYFSKNKSCDFYIWKHSWQRSNFVISGRLKAVRFSFTKAYL